MGRIWLAWALALAGCGPVAAPAPEPSVREAPPRVRWFRDATPGSGVDFTLRAIARGRLEMPDIMGGGCALFDADGDGDLDLYFTGAESNRLYAGRADGTFGEQGARSGLTDDGYGMGVAVGDVDNDGDVDVYLANHGPDRLLLNRGDGTFVPGAEVGVDGWSTSAVFCDYDADGWLDLFVARYVDYDPARSCSDAAGRPEYCQPQEFDGMPDVLLRNEGGGRFTDVSAAAGITGVTGAGLGVVCADLDGDRRPDFYVANDLDPNRLWVNRGDGTFSERGAMLGAAYNLQGSVESGMGVIGEDLDDDLDVDLYVTHLEGQTNTLYRNLGHGMGFEDATASAGLAGSLPYTGFGVVALDAELDGDLDLLVANGRVFRGAAREIRSVPAPWDRYAEPNLVYEGQGGGRFREVADEAFGGPVEVSRALCRGDIDDDGDVDVVVVNLQSAARVYVNEAARRGDWLLLRVVDPSLRRDAIGAEVTVVGEFGRLVRVVSRGFGYLASSDARVHVGLGGVGRPERIEVAWPDGSMEAFVPEGVNRQTTLLRGQGTRRR